VDNNVKRLTKSTLKKFNLLVMVILWHNNIHPMVLYPHYLLDNQLMTM